MEIEVFFPAPGTVCIYKLVDPRDNKPRYIGVTNNPGGRLMLHVKNASSTKLKVEWVNELRNLGMIPKMFIIDQCLESEREQREQYWIKIYQKEGYSLVNFQCTCCLPKQLPSISLKTACKMLGISVNEGRQRVTSRELVPLFSTHLIKHRQTRFDPSYITGMTSLPRVEAS